MSYYIRENSPPLHYKDNYDHSTADKIFNV